MDFTLDDEQRALSELAGRILTEQLPPERLKALEAADDGFPGDVWSALARADLLGLCLPEADGGAGYGMFEAALLLEQVGGAVAPVPLWDVVVLGAMPLARFGSAEQRRRWLPGVIAGQVLMTAALTEPGSAVAPEHPSTTATGRGDGWVLDGEKHLVAVADRAARVLVPATTGAGTTGVFLLDPASPGVTLEPQQITTGETRWLLTMTGAAADDVLGGPVTGDEIIAWLTDHALVGLCAMQAGVCEAALRLTAAYTSEREQFNAKIATFQAVAQRAADAYIDTEAVRLTSRQAAWRLAEGIPAADAIAVAKFWAADGGQRVVHAAQHLHGGIGVDVDYPVHRYFRWAKHLELTLGGAATHLLRIGARLAAEPI
ncbi:acyl-CoA dehydrogenase family protein [soil metagenome]